MSINNDDSFQSFSLVKRSKVRKLQTYASSTSSSGSNSSIANSPNIIKQKSSHHHNPDTDDGYASFTTTNSTTLASNNSSSLNRDDSGYYTTASSSKLCVESDSDRSDNDDDDDDDKYKDLVDWPSLNQQVQSLVSRLDKWLHNPLPDRSVPIEKSFVEHAYPILQRRTNSMPLAINLAHEHPQDRISTQSNYTVKFVQNNDLPSKKTNQPFKIPRPRVHFNLPTEKKVSFFLTFSKFCLIKIVILFFI